MAINPPLQRIMLALFLFTINLLQNCHATPQNGFSLKMIHRDSPESSIYRSNLTKEERLKEHREISDARIKSLATPFNSVLADGIQVPMGVSIHDYFWYVQIGIGTFAPPEPKFMTYYLGLDTGSQLTWVQCKGCEPNCFKMKDNKLFSADKSDSYKEIPSQDCHYVKGNIEDKHCWFKLHYLDNSKVKALAANETLVIKDANNNDVHLQKYTFGCGMEMRNFEEEARNPENLIGGLVGMGRHDLSFWNQARDKSLGKFSYCLPSPSATPHPTPVYLRFGNSIQQVQPQYMQSTPLKFNPKNDIPYYLTLESIIVDGTPLKVNPKVFDINPDGTGGFVIDSGSETSYIVTEAYKLLVAAVDQYMQLYNDPGVLKKLDPNVSAKMGYSLCYQQKSSANINYPQIVFQFANRAHFYIPEEANFVLNTPEDELCFSIRESTQAEFKGINILGSDQQMNQRIIYDVPSKELKFAPQDCLQHN